MNNRIKFEINSISYITTSENTVEVTDGEQRYYMRDVFIPDIVQYNSIEYYVTSVSQSALSNFPVMKTVRIPQSVISIELPFYKIYKSIIAINVDCENSNFSSIDGVLFNKSFTELISFPSAKITTSYEIPETVKLIKPYAFKSCSNLCFVRIPNSVTEIGDYAFFRCERLNYISFQNSITSIGVGVFEQSGLNSIDIPESVTSIGMSAFKGCCSLISATLPKALEKIGESAFQNCSNLKYINIPNSLTTISRKVFEGCSSLSSINIPNSIISFEFQSFKDCTSLHSITIPNSVKVFYTRAFYGCTSLEFIILPNFVSVIGLSLFENCTSLTHITLPDSLTIIPQNTFKFCTNLKTIDISNSITTIGVEAFQESGLSSITLPKSVSSVEYGAFAYSAIKHIDVDIENQYFCSVNGVLFNKSMTELIAYPPGKSVINYTIPETVITIGFSAFKTCNNLASVRISNSIKIIGCEAFKFCENLNSITIPNSVSEIRHSAFEHCSSLKSLTIPESLNVIYEKAFKDCKSLNEIVFCNSFTSLGNNSFDGCIALSNIYINDNQPIDLSTKLHIFSSVNKMTCTLYVPTGSKRDYQTAENWKDFLNIVEDNSRLRREIHNFKVINNANMFENINYLEDSMEIIWKNGLCGFRSENGQMITDFKYDDASLFKQGFAKVFRFGNVGLIDIYGHEVIDLVYQEIEMISYCYFKAKKDYKWSLINLVKGTFFSNSYDGISQYQDGIFCVKRNGKFGFINDLDVEIIPLIYDPIEFDLDYGETIYPTFKEGFVVVGHDKKHVLFNSKGKELISYLPVSCEDDYCCYYNLPEIGNGYALINTEGKHILLNTNGEILLNCECLLARFLTPELLLIKNTENKYGFYNINSKIILPFIYDEIVCLNDHLFKVKYHKKYGVIDSNNNKVIELKFEDIDPQLVDGFFYVKESGKFGLLDLTGKEIIPILYDRIQFVCTNWIIVTKNNISGILNYKNEIVLSLIYEQIFVSSFVEGLANVVITKKSSKNSVGIITNGFINLHGEIVIPIGYENFTFESFCEGLAIINHDSKSGFIDYTGNIVIPLVFDFVESFNIGLAKVRIDNKYGFIDKKGSVIVPIIYDDVELFENGVSIVKNDSKYGLIDLKGKVVIPVKYDILKRSDQLDESYSESLKKQVRIIAKYNFEYELFDCFGNCIIQKDKYSSMEFCVSGLIKVSNTKEVLSGPYGDYDDNPSYDNFRYEKQYSFGYINPYGKVIVPVEYFGVSGEKNGIISNFINCYNYGVYDVNLNEIVIPIVYKSIQILGDGLLKVQNGNDKYGYIDLNNKIVIPIMFDEIGTFHENKSIFVLNERRGYIDKLGNILKYFR